MTACTVVVYTYNSIVVALCNGADSIVSPLLHLWVGTLYGIQLNSICILACVNATYSATTHTDTVVVTTKKYNEGVLQFGTPDPAAVTAWQTFKLGNNSGAKPEYALYWDAENFYVLLKTGDATASYGKGAWWAGNDDLVQIWMTADGSM